MTSCDGLIGLTRSDLERRLGDPTAVRDTGSDTWIVFRSAELSLRVRLSGPAPRRTASWTASFTRGFTLLSEAARAVGLWPAAMPDVDATEVTVPLVRRALACPDLGARHSLTATVRSGSFVSLSVFDEEPEW